MATACYPPCRECRPRSLEPSHRQTDERFRETLKGRQRWMRALCGDAAGPPQTWRCDAAAEGWPGASASRFSSEARIWQRNLRKLREQALPQPTSQKAAASSTCAPSGPRRLGIAFARGGRPTCRATPRHKVRAGPEASPTFIANIQNKGSVSFIDEFTRKNPFIAHALHDDSRKTIPRTELSPEKNQYCLRLAIGIKIDQTVQ